MPTSAPDAPQHTHHLVNFNDNLLTAAATWLEQQSKLRQPDHQAATICDLSQVTILAPTNAIARPLAQAIAQQSGQPGLLPPRIYTPKQWALQHQPYTEPGLSQQLELAQWLHDHYPQSHGTPQQYQTLAAELQQTLQALAQSATLTQPDLTPNVTLETFQTVVQTGYDLPNIDSRYFDQETRMVYNAWLTFRAPYLAYPQALLHAVQQTHTPAHKPATSKDHHALVFTLGLHSLSTFEQQALRAFPQFDYGITPATDSQSPTTNRHRLILTQTLFSDADNLQNRATQLQPEHFNRLNLLPCDDPEHEAWVVCTQIRLWLANGKQHIALIAEDRAFGRRVRALLERQHIPLADRGGWNLATTSAATALERWLQVVETDAPAAALLDVLHSAFIQPDTLIDGSTEDYLQAIHHFEADLVHHENISQGLARYQYALEQRQQRLQTRWPQPTGGHVAQLLKQLQQASHALTQLSQRATCLPATFIRTLLDSLSLLGMQQQLAQDPAGIGLLECCQHIAQLPEQPLDWFTLRNLLRQTLESQAFRPPHQTTAVVLCNLEQAYLEQPDAVIIATASQYNIPGAAPNSSFFNQRVRQHLNLPNRKEFHKVQQHRFSRALNAAEDCLITWPNQQNDSPVLPANWVAQIIALQHLAGHKTKHKTKHKAEKKTKQKPATPESSAATTAMISAWAKQLSQANEPPSTAVMPSQQPRPPLAAAAALPTAVSASAHQDLVDCPYKFLYARVLGLRAPEPLRELLAKHEYGERVHRCLEAFTQGVHYLPGPFTKRLTTDNRTDAETLLMAIGDQVFARDTQDNIWHLGWQQQYNALIPIYLDWEIQHQTDWQWHTAEQRHSTPLFAAGELGDNDNNNDNDATVLLGRLDRIDNHRLDRVDNCATDLPNSTPAQLVIDYKTGALPKLSEVLAGEAVQLPSYALLNNHTTAVQYLPLQPGQPITAHRTLRLDGEDLQSLGGQVYERLQDNFQAIHNGAELPAHGDSKTCSYCDFAGICRQKVWRQRGDDPEQDNVQTGSRADTPTDIPT